MASTQTHSQSMRTEAVDPSQNKFIAKLKPRDVLLLMIATVILISLSGCGGANGSGRIEGLWERQGIVRETLEFFSDGTGLLYGAAEFTWSTEDNNIRLHMPGNLNWVGTYEISNNALTLELEEEHFGGLLSGFAGGIQVWTKVD